MTIPLAQARSNEAPRPLGLIAELTYRCPLHCPYCSNPVRYPEGREELCADEWGRVFTEAAKLGVVHALFSGGEPLGRRDLPALVEAARGVGLYTNLITSAVGLTPARARELVSAGLDSVQISFQADEPALADEIAGTSAHGMKVAAAQLVRSLGLPLTVNVVLHRGNIDRLERIIRMAESLGAMKLELANVQFYGWAMRNRASLLPTRQQVEQARRVASEAQRRLNGRMQVIFVVPDYYADRPKPCMNGWGQRYIAVNPVGDVLPCPTAYEIRSMRFENVRERELGWIWRESESFNRFRGTEWMPEPCRSCDQREIDFGGCRCQAALLTGEAANTDPACALSPHRPVLEALVDSASSSRALPVYRSNPRSAETQGVSHVAR